MLDDLRRLQAAISLAVRVLEDLEPVVAAWRAAGAAPAGDAAVVADAPAPVDVACTIRNG